MKQEDNLNEIRYSFLKDYAEGGPSEKKKEQIGSWLENPEFGFKSEQYLRELWKDTDPDKVNSPTGLNVILDRIHHKINISQSNNPPLKGRVQNIHPISLNTTLKHLSRIAAIFLFPIMAYLGWEVFDQKMWNRSQAEAVYNEFFCPLGARSHFELPDGTSGWLNNGSRLKFPAKFLNDSREVELIGEAYFDVATQKKRPFIIKTIGLDVKVLGTKLNVSAYPDEKVQAFTLVEGSIELIKRKGEEELSVLKMEPGQHAVFALNLDNMDMPSENRIINEQEKTIAVEQTPDKKGIATQGSHTPGSLINIGFEETSQYTEWKNGKLVLRNDPMPVMLKRIERWYNVKFNITDDRINHFRYWATFEEENLDQVLKMLSLTGPLNFNKHDREQTGEGTFKVQEIDILLKND